MIVLGPISCPGLRFAINYVDILDIVSESWLALWLLLFYPSETALSTL
jgi:hypothetical protein